MKYQLLRRPVACGIMLAACVAHATSLYSPVVSSVQIPDIGAMRIDALLMDGTSYTRPWTAEVFAGRGECLRLFVISTAFDSKITLVAPNGQVYRDDDGGDNLRPLVKVVSTPVAGWYTVHVAEYAGRPANAPFTLLYGRYVAGNINCAGGTVPMASPVFDGFKDTGEIK